MDTDLLQRLQCEGMQLQRLSASRSCPTSCRPIRFITARRQKHRYAVVVAKTENSDVNIEPASKTIRILNPRTKVDEIPHISHKTFERFLNIYGCGNGCFKAVKSGELVCEFADLEQDALYEPYPVFGSQKPSVENVTLVAPPSVVEGKQEPGKVQKFSSLNQKGLDRILESNNAYCLVSEVGPPDGHTEVSKLQPGGTYYMVTAAQPTLRQQVSG